MVIRQFPSPRDATPEGIVAVGGDLDPESLILAYHQGIFPWPISGMPLPWFSPPERGILEIENLHLSRSLLRARRRSSFRFTFDQAFDAVVQECSQVPREGQPGTWITSAIKKAYSRLHRLGHAHSVEVWQEDRLVGGLYGVDAGGPFAGESMFHRETNASKLALVHLLEFLAAQGLDWMDVQTLTPHLEAMGGRLISRDEFLMKLQLTQARGLKIW